MPRKNIDFDMGCVSGVGVGEEAGGSGGLEVMDPRCRNLEIAFFRETIKRLENAKTDSDIVLI